jgi:hypothetical protein
MINPQQAQSKINQLLESGQMSQEQFNNLKIQAQQILNILK